MSQAIPQNAVDWNNFFNLAAAIALVALAVVVAAMIYFTFRYRERKGQAPFIPEKHLSKTRARDAMIFAIISIIILFSVTVAGDRMTPNARFQPAVADSYVMQVRAYQWSFDFTYPNGAFSRGSLVLPANTTVMFNVTSTDVMHNFFLVDFKVSIDAIPGRYNLIWITTPQVEGNNNTLSYVIVCKELCGTGHTNMRAPMTIMSVPSFKQWLSNQTVTNSTATGGT